MDRTERLNLHFSLSCIGEGNDNPFQCSCLENPRDRGAWWVAICGVAESDTTEVTYQQQQHTKAQGLVEVNLFSILDPFGSNQFMSCPWSMSHLFKFVPCPLLSCFRTSHKKSQIGLLKVYFRLVKPRTCHQLSTLPKGVDKILSSQSSQDILFPAPSRK